MLTVVVAMSEIMDMFPLFMYKLYGLWPEKDSHIAYKIYGTTYHLITLDLYLIYMMICFCKVTNLEEFTDTACIGGIYFALWLKSINMIYHLDNVRALFHLLKDVIDFSDEGQTRKELKSATRRVLRAYKMFAFMALMNVSNNIMLTFTNTENKLPYFFWFPIDYVENNTVFWIVATFQNVASLTNCILVCKLYKS